MQEIKKKLLLLSIIKDAHLLLRTFDLKNKCWSGTEGDEALFANYVNIWACYEVGLKGRKEINNALEWFIKKRNQEGIWSYNHGKKRTQATSRALIALLLTDKISPEKALPGVHYVVRQQSEQGGWPDEESDVQAEVSGIGQTLPAIFLLSLYKRKTGDSKSVQDAIDRCKIWLENEIHTLRHNASSTNDWLLKYTWALRIYVNATNNSSFAFEEAQELSAPLLIELKNNSSCLWKLGDKNYQALYNVLHSLTLLKNNLENPAIELGLNWLHQRFEHVYPSDIKAKGRELRFLSGLIICEAKLYKTTFDALPDVAGYISAEKTGYTPPMKKEKVILGLDKPWWLNFWKVLCFLWENLNWKSKIALGITLFLAFFVSYKILSFIFKLLEAVK